MSTTQGPGRPSRPLRRPFVREISRLPSSNLLKSTVEALRAVAAARDLKLRSDANIWDFGEALATDWRNTGVFSSVFPVARFAFLDSFGGYSFTFEELQAYHEYIAEGVKELQTMASAEISQ